MSRVIRRVEESQMRELGGNPFWRSRFERDEFLYDDNPEFSSPDACLIRSYMKTPKGLHVRRTLDQSHYSMLPRTEERDLDQILLKRGTRGKVVMVDQLWLWMFEGVLFLPRRLNDDIHLIA